MEHLLGTGHLGTNVPAEWQHDSAAAPNGASSLSGNQTCNWGDEGLGPECKIQPPTAVGNLLWTLSLLEQAAAYSGNATVLTDVLCPLLDRALQFYQHIQIGGNSSMPEVHLPSTFSPEYPGPPGSDANYDVSLYRWGLQQGIDLAARFPDAPLCGGPHLAAWKDTLARFTWFPVDAATNTLARQVHARHHPCGHNTAGAPQLN